MKFKTKQNHRYNNSVSKQVETSPSKLYILSLSPHDSRRHQVTDNFLTPFPILVSVSLLITTLPFRTRIDATGGITGFSLRRRIQRSENRLRDPVRQRPPHGSAGAPPGFPAGVVLALERRGIRLVGPQRRLRAQRIHQGQ